MIDEPIEPQGLLPLYTRYMSIQVTITFHYLSDHPSISSSRPPTHGHPYRPSGAVEPGSGDVMSSPQVPKEAHPTIDSSRFLAPLRSPPPPPARGLSVTHTTHPSERGRIPTDHQSPLSGRRPRARQGDLETHHLTRPPLLSFFLSVIFTISQEIIARASCAETRHGNRYRGTSREAREEKIINFEVADDHTRTLSVNTHYVHTYVHK